MTTGFVNRSYDRYTKATKRRRELLDAVADNGGTYDTKSRHYYVGYERPRCDGHVVDKYVFSISQSEYKFGDFSHPREHGYIIEEVKA